MSLGVGVKNVDTVVVGTSYIVVGAVASISNIVATVGWTDLLLDFEHNKKEMNLKRYYLKMIKKKN